MPQVDLDLGGDGAWEQTTRGPRAPAGSYSSAASRRSLVRAIEHSIRIDDQWRICFLRTDAGPENVEIIDYH